MGVSPQKPPNSLLTVPPSLPRAVCVLGPSGGWHGILTILFTFHHCYKEIQHWVKTPKALLQVQHSRLAKNWSCLLVKQISECFISFALRRWGAKVWIQAGWCEFSFRKSSSQHYFITLLIQLWRNTCPTPHRHAFHVRVEAPKPGYNFILSVGFIISLLEYVIICISWSPMNSSCSSLLLFKSLPWKLVGAFGSHSNKTELFLSPWCRLYWHLCGSPCLNCFRT